MQETVAKVVVWALAIFYGFLTIFGMAVLWVKHVFRFFKVKERPLPPACLVDDSLGRHGFAKLKVSYR